AEERVEVLVDRRLDHPRALGERGAAQTVEAGLARLDLHDDEPDFLRRGEDGPDLGDLQRPGRPRRVLLLGQRPGAARESGQRRPLRELRQEMSAVHRSFLPIWYALMWRLDPDTISFSIGGRP